MVLDPLPFQHSYSTVNGAVGDFWQIGWVFLFFHSFGFVGIFKWSFWYLVQSFWRIKSCRRFLNSLKGFYDDITKTETTNWPVCCFCLSNHDTFCFLQLFALNLFWSFLDLGVCTIFKLLLVVLWLCPRFVILFWEQRGMKLNWFI